MSDDAGLWMLSKIVMTESEVRVGTELPESIDTSCCVKAAWTRSTAGVGKPGDKQGSCLSDLSKR